MAEYDPRPSRSRREHILDKLRKALPWPENARGVSTSRATGGGGSGGGGSEYIRDAPGFDIAGEAAGGRRVGRLEGAPRKDGYYADDVSVGGRRASPEEGQSFPHAGGEGDGAGGDAEGEGRVDGPADECQGADGKRGSGDSGLGSTHGESGCGRGAVETDGMTSTGNGVLAPDGGGDREEVHPGPPPPSSAPPSEEGAEEHDGNPSVISVDGDRARDCAISKRPATGQRKARRKHDTADERIGDTRDPKHYDMSSHEEPFSYMGAKVSLRARLARDENG